jgi:acyl-coenzyme A thioesterase PaaI-like protein
MSRAVDATVGAAVQDHYPDDYSHCYGCGRLNTAGHHVRTQWDGEAGTCTFTPRPEHMAMPGFVYGGLIASLVDCHAIGTAAAASEHAAGRRIGEVPAPRFVTAALHVAYLKPTPLGPELQLTARPKEVGARKVILDVTVRAGTEVTATGEVVAVRLPDSMKPRA